MIDWNRVNTLRDEVGAEDFSEIVELFLEEVSAAVSKLAEAPNKAALEADLHFLKGSAVGLGFRDFSDLCQKGEMLLAQNKMAESDLLAILDSFAESNQMFQRELEAQLRN